MKFSITICSDAGNNSTFGHLVLSRSKTAWKQTNPRQNLVGFLKFLYKLNIQPANATLQWSIHFASVDFSPSELGLGEVSGLKRNDYTLSLWKLLSYLLLDKNIEHRREEPWRRGKLQSGCRSLSSRLFRIELSWPRLKIAVEEEWKNKIVWLVID